MDQSIDPTTTMDDQDDALRMEERRSKSKRRKTTGDVIPDSTANSSYHTQTLTQMPSFMSERQPEDDDEPQGGVDFNTDDIHPATMAAADELYEASPVKEKKDPTPSVRQEGTRPSVPPQSPIGSVVAQTPRKQIVERAVIPSSQPSPFTPNLGIAERYWSLLDRTPLEKRSTNMDAPTPTATGKKRPRTLEIEDSWSTVNGGMGSSPLKGSERVRRTPLKEISLVEMANVSADLGESPAGEDDSVSHQKLVEDGVATGTEEAEMTLQRSTRPADEVIFDSEDEFDFELEDDDQSNEDVPGTPTPAHRASHPGTEKVPSKTPGTPMPSAPKAASQPSTHNAAQRNLPPEPPAKNDEDEHETPSPSPLRPPSASSGAVEAQSSTPLSSPQKTSPTLPPVSQSGPHDRFRALTSQQKTFAAMLPPVSQLGYRHKSQAFESQRVPFEKIRQLGPQTDRSDVILSIHPEQAEQIAEGVKTHEFRNYRIPQTVGRIWIYVTRPMCELMYMAPISPAKQPGEISLDDPGVGNKEFNEGTGMKFAYELKQVYELNNPVSLARMKKNGWVEEAPAKYVYVPPAVLGELLGNLRCALFAEPGELQSSQVGMSVSQEVAMQLHSDIAHSTQMDLGGSSQPRRPLSGDKDQDAVAPSQAGIGEHGKPTIRATGARPADEAVFAKPTIPQSRSQRSVHWVGDSPMARRSQPSQHVPNSAVRPSQATTASAPSSQSQQLPPPPGPRQTRNQASIPVSPPTKSVRRPQLVESSSLPAYPEDMVIVGDSPVRRRGGMETQSSLLLGSSQSLAHWEPDSLLDDSRVRQPPDVVWDSDGEIE